MRFESDHQGEAAAALGHLQDLLKQQEYEFQRLFADAQLTVMRLKAGLAMHGITGEAVEAIERTAANMKYDLREAREHAQEAARRLEDLERHVQELDQQEPGD